MWELSCGGWSSGPIAVAVGPLPRLRGLVPRSDHGLLLRASSVHGIGMAHPLLVVGLVGRRVGSVRILPPGGVVTDRSATAVVELPAWRDGPPVGAVLAIRRIP